MGLVDWDFVDRLSVVDYEGQRLAEQLMMWFVMIIAAISFVVGFATADWWTMVYINAAGLALTSLVVLPPWPWYRRNTLTWLPALNPPKGKEDKKQ